MRLTATVLVIAFCTRIVGTYECSGNLPIKVDRACYHLSVIKMKFEDASKNCQNLEEGAHLTTIRTEKVMKKITENVNAIVRSGVKSAAIWNGVYMDDKDTAKQKKDRKWKWTYDDSEFVQKEFPWWITEDGPTSSYKCAIINSSVGFRVQDEDCDSNRYFPVLCSMSGSKPCKNENVPYLMYGKYCLGMKDRTQYRYITSTCNPEKVSPFKNEMRDDIVLAIKNSFLGGAVFVNIEKVASKFIDKDTDKEVDASLWAEGEPRNEYSCVGLSVQKDDTLKLRTINCNFIALSLCVIEYTGTD